jgi:hypothetical protein
VIVQNLVWGGAEAAPIPFQTKSGFVRLAKDVSVVDHAKKQQKMASLTDAMQLIGRDELSSGKEWGRFIGAQYQSRRHIACDLPEVYWIAFHDANIDVYLSQNRRRFSLIPEGELNFQNIAGAGNGIGSKAMLQIVPEEYIRALDNGDMFGSCLGSSRDEAV